MLQRGKNESEHVSVPPLISVVPEIVSNMSKLKVQSDIDVPMTTSKNILAKEEPVLFNANWNLTPAQKKF